jgi:hypothetical protein
VGAEVKGQLLFLIGRTSVIVSDTQICVYETTRVFVSENVS